MQDNQTQTALAYMAGLFDGEGTLSIGCDKPNPPKWISPRYFPFISIGMVDEGAIRRVSSVFGGTVYAERGYHGHRKIYRWRQCGRKKVSSIVEMLYPYLCVKKEQATLLLEFCELLSRKWKEKTIRDCIACKRNGIIHAYGLCGQCYHKERKTGDLSVKFKQYAQNNLLPSENLLLRQDFYLRMKELNLVGVAATTNQEDTREREVIV